MPKVGFFPGSTIGNFDPHEASAFLGSARAILGPGATMIVGVDLEKDERVLHDAYNDAAGVTGQFNLNVLARINRELGGKVLPAGSYVMRAMKDGVSFEAVTMTCEGGTLVNASPPFGLQAL